jgi:hypothetical protein
MRMLTHAQMAEICHEANRLYCQFSQSYTTLKWLKLDSRAQKGIVAGVEFIQKNPDATAEDCHENWCQWMLGDGWTPGGVLDRMAKVHPNIAPYDTLPARERIKDEIFIGIVRACLLPLREVDAALPAEADPGDEATQTAP